MPARLSALRRIPGRLLLVAVALLPAAPRHALAQRDTARVTYRTTEVVFVSAGRAEGIRVGDTVTVETDSGRAVARAVVTSVALRSSSARMLSGSGAVEPGLRVRFVPHPPPARPDSTAAAPLRAAQALVPADALRRDTVVTPRPSGPWPSPTRSRPPRWSGGLQLEQLASSTGGLSALTSTQTVAGLTLTAPIAPGVELRTRASTRWRAGAAGRTTGMDGVSTLLYQLEARLAPPRGSWNASLGRFLPAEAMALGYVDGARVEVRVAPEQRVGVLAGFVPRVQRLDFSTATRRAGAYWAFGGAGALTGSVAAAADWEGGARRRTLMATQTSWRPMRAVSLWSYTEVDAAAPWQSFTGLRVTTGYLSVRADLPYAFRASLGAETHLALPLWEFAAAGDTAAPPGRLNGVNASLGRDVAGFRIDASGGLLKRATDATPTVRGLLTVARGALFLTASGQHGDLFDYGALSARVLVPPGALPVTASLGIGASFTRSAGGALTQWRYSIQPEISRSLGGGLFASLGGDLGSYAGRTSVFLHAGASYRFR